MEQNWSDEDIKVMEGMEQAAKTKDVKINTKGGAAGADGVKAG